MKEYRSEMKLAKCFLISVGLFFIFIFAGLTSEADVNYELTYSDPAGDVLDYNETWHLNGTVDKYPQIDLKWLKSYNDTYGNVVLRLEVKKNQVIEKSNYTRYAFRIFTSQDNSTGYNVTYKNGTTTITDFNNTIEDDLTAETSIIFDSGEVLLVNISKDNYLNNTSHFNIDAYTWKEAGNHTYIDYVSEIPGHPGETGNVVDNGTSGSHDDWMLWLLLLILLIIIVIIIVIAVLKHTNRI